MSRAQDSTCTYSEGIHPFRSLLFSFPFFSLQNAITIYIAILTGLALRIATTP